MPPQYLPGLWLPMQKRRSLLQSLSLTNGSVHVSKIPQGTPRDTRYFCVGNRNHLWYQPSSFTLLLAKVKSEIGSLPPASCPANKTPVSILLIAIPQPEATAFLTACWGTPKHAPFSHLGENDPGQVKSVSKADLCQCTSFIKTG